MDVVGYCRYSSEGQRDGFSIEAQQRAIRDFCESEKYNIIKFYVEEARSGTNDNREAFQDMIEDAKLRKFKAIIVHKFDRFARNKYDSVFYKRKLRDLDIKVISICEPLDDSPESVILESLYEGMSEYYSRNLSREVLKGKKEAALKCQHNGGIPPYGYTVDKEMHYVIIPEEAKIIQMVFEKAELGFSHAAIARYLNERGFKNRAGNRFGREYITRMLVNELYKGTFVYGKKSKRANSNIIKVENALDPIISPYLFDKVNKIYNDAYSINREKREIAKAKNAGIDYLLTGYAICGCCGAPLTGFHSHKAYQTSTGADRLYSSYFYRCSRKAKRETVLTGMTRGCILKNLRKDNFEDFILGVIENIIFNETNLKLIVEKAKQLILEKINKKIDNTKIINEINRISNQLNRLLDIFLDGTIDKESYNVKKNELEKMQNYFKEQIKTYPKIDVDKLTPQLLKKSIDKFLSSANADTIEYKKKTLSTFVDSIIVDNKKIVIYFKFPINTSDNDKKSEFSYDNHFLHNSTTVSTLDVCGNISSGCIERI